MLTNPQRPQLMTHDFSRVPHADIPRSTFNLSRTYKTAFDAGYLVPIFAEECLPGDTWHCELNAMARLATPIVPFIDNLYLDFFFFAVPNRLVWDNWKKFMGEQVDPGDSTDYTVPIMTAHAVTTGTLSDYFGLPVGAGNVEYNSLHHRAYNLIWNEWFRDQNLQDSVTVDKDDGPDSIADYVLLKRGKRMDYLTGCLPWPQKGDSVSLPLGDTAPVIGSGKTLGLTTGAGSYGLGFWTGDGDIKAGTTLFGTNFGSSTASPGSVPGAYSLGVTTAAASSGLIADLDSATASSVNEIRQAFQLQRMYERDARGGTRYPEILISHFGVTDPMSSVLQRPEYLGGGRTRVGITPIPQTSESGTTKQGNLAAVGFAETTSIGFTKSFTEHSLLIGMVCCTADLTYQRSLRRMWSRQTRADFYFPALAHLSEQAVLNKEVYHQGTSADDDVFGYQERWSEYRYGMSEITSVLRSDATTTPIDEWHLSQDFGSLPTLNSDFIEESPPVSRVVAVATEPQLKGDFFFRVIAARPMPVYSVPGMIDHF
jgi:hypothetical protein